MDQPVEQSLVGLQQIVVGLDMELSLLVDISFFFYSSKLLKQFEFRIVQIDEIWWGI